jgi:hypothetical protein
MNKIISWTTKERQRDKTKNTQRMRENKQTTVRKKAKRRE